MRSRLVMFTAFLLACGGGDDGGAGGYGGGPPTGPGGSTPPPPSGSGSVSMSSTGGEYDVESHSFSPAAVSVTAGGTVTWTNSTGISHNVTFSAGGAPAAIPSFISGSQSRTFPTSGTWNYACTNHQGMTGQVVVP